MIVDIKKYIYTRHIKWISHMNLLYLSYSFHNKAETPYINDFDFLLQFGVIDIANSYVFDAEYM